MKASILRLLPALLIICLMAIACTSAPGQVQHPTLQQDNTTSTSTLSTGEQSAGTTEAQSEPLPEYPVTLIDNIGRTVIINSCPQRIISMAPSNTEILFALGLDDSIAGVTDYCNYPESAKSKPRIAGYSTPNIEKLISLNPDFIIADSIHEKTVLPRLEKLGIPIYVMKAVDIDTIMNNIAVIGKVTGKSNRASQIIDSMKVRIAAVEAKTENLSVQQRPKVLWLINWNPIYTMGSKNFTNDAIKIAGGTNAYEADFERQRAISLESIIAKNPNIIIVSGMGGAGDKLYNSVRGESRLASVDALIKDRVYRMSDPNLIERAGPRIVDGIEEVARIIHPEIFGPAAENK